MSDKKTEIAQRKGNKYVIMKDDIHKSLPDVPPDTPIIFMIELGELEKSDALLKKAIERGFRHPIITRKFKENKSSSGHLCLFHKHDDNYGKKVDKDVIKNVHHSVSFCVKNYEITNRMNICSVFLVFSRETLKYLEKYVKEHKFHVDGGQTEQREISGSFKVKPISNNTVTVEVNKKHTDTGQKEEASYFETVASFHTHPLEAYQKYNVCLAYPSVDDYLTVLHIYANYFGMFHVTATLEGIYVIMISPEFNDSQEEIKKDFEGKYKKYVEKNYAIDYPVCDPNKENKEVRKKNLEGYLNLVNKLKYFRVVFRDWKDAENPIEINYKPVNNTCILSDEQIDFHKLISVRS